MDGHVLPEGYICSTKFQLSENGSLECNQESCKCGDNICHKGENCDLSNHGVISCDGMERPKSDGIPVKDYICDHGEWTCSDPAGCACNGMICPEGAVCGDDGCTCARMRIAHDMPVFKCDANELKCNAGNCTCDGTKIKKGEACFMNLCSIGVSWQTNFKTKNDACLCNDKVMDSSQYICVMARNKEHALCTDNTGCKCDKNTCPYMSLCSNGSCVDRLTLKPIPDNYRTREGLAYCDSANGCSCGKKTCEQGKYCLDGVCFRDPYTRKSDLYNGKVLYYRISDSADALDKAMEDSFVDEYKQLGLDNYAIQREIILNLIQYRNQENHPEFDICDVVHSLLPDKIELHEYNEFNPFEISLCDSPEYKINPGKLVNPAVSFIENCGTDNAPKDVATKYCYIRFYTISDAHYDPHFMLEFSGWQNEDFKWEDEFADDE